MSTPSVITGLLLINAMACATAGTAGDTDDGLAPAPVVCDAQHAGDDTSHVFTQKEVNTHAHPVRGTNVKSMFEDGPPPGKRYVITLRLVVDTLGRPDPCRALVSAENEPGIGAEALEKMLSWRFVPATRRGRKVPELLVMTIKMGDVFDWEYREPQDRQR